MASITTPKGVFLLVKGIIVLIIVVIAEIIGYILLFLGLDDFWILDTICILVVGADELYDYLDSKTEQSLAISQVQEEEETEEAPSTINLEEKRAELKKTRESSASQSKTGDLKKPTPPSTQKSLPSTTTKTATKANKGIPLNPKDAVRAEFKELTKKSLKKFGLSALVEIVPYLGGAWPSWTILAVRKLWRLFKGDSQGPNRIQEESPESVPVESPKQAA